MGKFYINAANNFVKTVIEIGNDLKTFTIDADNKKEQIDSILQNLVNRLGEFKTELNNEDPFQNKILETKKGMLQSLEYWRREVNKFTRSYEFMRENEKNMLVMVFGAVKTGKSSLGNFLGGKEFLEAKEDNHYKDVYKNPEQRPQFKIEEEGRENNLEGGWFREDSIDATGAIQHFTLGGMKWIDSPGTGAVKKAGDKFAMEPLVAKYLDDVDFGVFLMASDNPGLLKDFAYMRDMYKKNKPIMVVITRSDTSDFLVTSDGKLARDSEGNFIDVDVPKTAENRKLQEDYIKSQAAEYGIDNLDVMSISVKIARIAIENGDEEQYIGSNMDKFYSKLLDCIGKDTTKLKIKNPQDRINNLVSGIVSGMDVEKVGVKFQGIDSKIEELNELKKDFIKKQTEIEDLKKSIVNKVKIEVSNEVHGLFEKLKVDFDRDGEVDVKPFSSKINNLVKNKATVILNKKINEIINGFESKFLKLEFNENYQLDIHPEYATFEKKLEYVEYVRRDPDGVVETVLSWFGRDYYKEKRSTKIVVEKIPVGNNISKERDKILENLESTLNDFIGKELKQLSSSYYSKQITMLDNMIKDLTEAKNEILSLRVG